MHSRLDAHALHVRIGRGGWAAILEQLGVPAAALRPRRQQSCPACGGTDRYCYDDRTGHGDFICRRCGAGDGFSLLRRIHGWDFPTVRARVIEAMGLEPDTKQKGNALPFASPPPSTGPVAGVTPRVRDLRRGCCAPDAVADVITYLESRKLWPLPPKCTLRAHPAVAYYEDRAILGQFAALVADICDLDGELVTVHLTYLEAGRKLTGREPRKILSPLTGRAGCAVRLMPLVGETLGIGEGIETCLAAHALHDDVPTWSALNTALLMKFEPPKQVRHLVVFTDNDLPGSQAALRLLERLQGRVHVEPRTPPAPHKDWADVLEAQS